MTDLQDRYRLVSSGFDAAVRAVTPDKWEAQSPCEEWTARDVVAHVVEGHRGVIAGVRGGESKPLGADEDPRQAWENASRAIDEITGDAEAMAKEVDGPTGKMPVGQIIGQFVTMECSSTPGTSPVRSVRTSVSTRTPSATPTRLSSQWTP